MDFVDVLDSFAYSVGDFAAEWGVINNTITLHDPGNRISKTLFVLGLDDFTNLSSQNLNVSRD